MLGVLRKNLRTVVFGIGAVIFLAALLWHVFLSLNRPPHPDPAAGLVQAMQNRGEVFYVAPHEAHLFIVLLIVGLSGLFAAVVIGLVQRSRPACREPDVR